MILGVSKTDITPSLPVKLGGFAFRHRPCTQIGMPLYARCFILNRQHAVVSLELLFAGDNLNRQIRSALADIPELAGLDLILTATHSHSAPQTADTHSPQLGECDPQYNAFIIQQVITGLRTALAAGQPVTAHITESPCPLAVHRRLMVSGEITMAPNPDEPADTIATLVRFTNTDQKVCAVLVHNQCHPTITGDNILSGEYPGVVCDEIETAFQEQYVCCCRGFAGICAWLWSVTDSFTRGLRADGNLRKTAGGALPGCTATAGFTAPSADITAIFPPPPGIAAITVCHEHRATDSVP